MKIPFPAAISTVFLCAATALATDTKLPALILQPAQMELRPGTFELTPSAAIGFAGGETEVQQPAVTLRIATGFHAG